MSLHVLLLFTEIFPAIFVLLMPKIYRCDVVYGWCVFYTITHQNRADVRWAFKEALSRKQHKKYNKATKQIGNVFCWWKMQFVLQSSFKWVLPPHAQPILCRCVSRYNQEFLEHRGTYMHRGLGAPNLPGNTCRWDSPSTSPSRRKIHIF